MVERPQAGTAAGSPLGPGPSVRKEAGGPKGRRPRKRRREGHPDGTRHRERLGYAKTGQNSQPIRDRTSRRIEREVDRRGIDRTDETGVGQCELAGTSARSVVPAEPDERLADE